jgi:hypothetical protein
MHYTRITFPQLHLSQRDAHKLRGYFGRLFQQESPLLHNHYQDGTLRYQYPLVQYKIIEGIPTLVGLGEGSDLLTQLFLRMETLELDGLVYPIDHKAIAVETIEPRVDTALHRYELAAPCIALNQKNYALYRDLPEEAHPHFLNRMMCNHLVAVLRSLGADMSQRVMVDAQLTPTPVQYKGQRMLGFKGSLTTNAWLPEAVGIGKSVSRGFGTLLP